jgi:hypothetical protein
MSDEQRQWTHLRLHFWVVSQATHFGMNSCDKAAPSGEVTGETTTEEPLGTSSLALAAGGGG